jgi:hypothetical protein
MLCPVLLSKNKVLRILFHNAQFSLEHLYLKDSNILSINYQSFHGTNTFIYLTECNHVYNFTKNRKVSFAHIPLALFPISYSTPLPPNYAAFASFN